LFIEMDNTSRDNKNQYVLGYLTHLVDSNVFKTIYVSFLVPGHTHEDIDQLFSVLTEALRSREGGDRSRRNKITSPLQYQHKLRTTQEYSNKTLELKNLCVDGK